MSDPAASESTLNLISQASEILAAHGVYALTVIFIFYQQRRAYVALSGASPEDHPYFRKVYTSVVAATYVLMALSTGIWFYANFMYSQHSYIKGTIMGLSEQRTPPLSKADKPEIIQAIASAGDDELYTAEKASVMAADGTSDLSWVLFPKSKITSLAFRFEHHYETFQAVSPNADPLGSLPPHKAETIRGLFGLDLSSIHYSPGQSIQLMYEPDPKDGISRIGHLYLLVGSQKLPLSWQTSNADEAQNATPASPLHSKLLSYLSPWSVFAATLGNEAHFGQNGEYDPEFGSILRERLGGSSLTAQLDTIQFLVDQGARSFKFISDSLADTLAGRFDEGLLKHNLESTVERLESNGVHAPPQISLQLAMVSYKNQDYKIAARYFDRAGDAPLSPGELLFYRSYARYEAEEYQLSAKDLRKFLAASHKKEFEAPAHASLGNCFWKLNRVDDAIAQYTRAIQSDRTYALAYNNLAYMYAERGQNLEQALDLVNTALRLNNNGPHGLAEDKDTKAWILFKLGRASEALPLIQEASSELQDDRLVQSHFREIQRAATAQAKQAK
ncbi:MAG TPA: tetratricopeptide repeat protein [Candidatus Acidoferrum sp.]|nr:tetratricopeptide repeat protein [Candidatus Acidoferrum sp.]